MLNELLEQLHQAENNKQGSKIEIVYVASGGQHVETQINIGAHPNEGSEEPTSVTPPPEAMARAVERTMAQGYWWASTAWAVVYRVYQMKGYTGGIRQFVREVKEWPFSDRLDYECNYDAVCKPIRSGRLAGTPDGWINNGSVRQTIHGTAEGTAMSGLWFPKTIPLVPKTFPLLRQFLPEFFILCKFAANIVIVLDKVTK